MVARTRRAFHDGLNAYVPGMSYASDLIHGQPVAVSLGSPAALSDNAVDASVVANAVAGTEEAQTYVSDSPYGRTLIVTPSADPGAAGAFDVHGFDYLGQPMAERFTFVNGSTAILYGKKAFYNVSKTRIVTAATNAITAKVGRGYRIGLPYKCDLNWAKEDGVFVNLYKRDVIFDLDRAAAKAVAGGTDFIRSPFPGFVKSIYGTPAGGGGVTDPVITVKLGGTAIVGLTITIDTSDVAGLTVNDAPTTAGYTANNRFIAGGVIEIVGGAATGAFADRIGLELTPTQFVHPVATDPQTLTTDDPRGTYESLMVMNGVKEIVVGMLGDNAVNAAGNGGLHGIKHVVA